MMLKFMFGDQTEITVDTIFASMGVGTPEARAEMRQMLINNSVVPNQFVDDIIDLGFHAGMTALRSALDQIDTVTDLATNVGVRQAVGQIGVQLVHHAMSVISESMIATLKDNTPEAEHVNLMAKASG